MAKAKFNDAGGVTLEVSAKDASFLHRLLGCHIVGRDEDIQPVGDIYETLADLYGVDCECPPLNITPSNFGPVHTLYVDADTEPVAVPQAPAVDLPRKVGDKIRVTGTDSSAGKFFFDGDVGVIVHFDTDGTFLVDFRGQGNPTVTGDGEWWIADKQGDTFHVIERAPVAVPKDPCYGELA